MNIKILVCIIGVFQFFAFQLIYLKPQYPLTSQMDLTVMTAVHQVVINQTSSRTIVVQKYFFKLNEKKVVYH